MERFHFRMYLLFQLNAYSPFSRILLQCVLRLVVNFVSCHCLDSYDSLLAESQSFTHYSLEKVF